jgi:hypothetical protein
MERLVLSWLPLTILKSVLVVVKVRASVAVSRSVALRVRWDTWTSAKVVIGKSNGTGADKTKFNLKSLNMGMDRRIAKDKIIGFALSSSITTNIGFVFHTNKAIELSISIVHLLINLNTKGNCLISDSLAVGKYITRLHLNTTDVVTNKRRKLYALGL